MIFMRKWDPIARDGDHRAREGQRDRRRADDRVAADRASRSRTTTTSPAWRAIAYGGAPSAPELVKRIYEEFGALPGNGWGMTETTATVTSHSAARIISTARPARGRRSPVADLKIMDDDGATELPVGEVGELWARGPMIVKGYWNKPEATARDLHRRLGPHRRPRAARRGGLLSTSSTAPRTW